MKKLLFIWLAWVVIGGLSAQNNKCADMSALLENKVWKVQNGAAAGGTQPSVNGTASPAP